MRHREVLQPRRALQLTQLGVLIAPAHRPATTPACAAPAPRCTRLARSPPYEPSSPTEQTSGTAGLPHHATRSPINITALDPTAALRTEPPAIPPRPKGRGFLAGSW
jgi:hypothetical protein